MKQKKGGYMRLDRSIAYSKDLTATDKLIWCIVADKCDSAMHFDGTRWAVLSITSLAQSIGVARNTAVRSLQRLCDAGLIERQTSMIQGYPDRYSVPEQDIIDAIIDSLARYNTSKQ